jgi:hypothetical protein
MNDLEKQLVELDLDIARAKQYRRDMKATLAKGNSSDQEISTLEKRLVKTKQAIKDCKIRRKAIIEQLLTREIEAFEADAAAAKEAAAVK